VLITFFKMLLLLFVGVGLAVRLLGEGSLQFREYEVSWNQSFFAGSVVRDRQKFQFAVSSPLGVLTIWASVNASGLFPPCTIKSMRCLDPRDKSVKEIFPFFHTGGFQLDRVGDQFTLTATASQLVNPSVNATIYLYWTAQRLSTLSRRSFTDSDIKFDFDVSLPARPDCEWQLSTGWPGLS
jgi:hypothetical protein